MADLSGFVAVLDAPGAAANIIDVRNLGPKMTAVKRALVLPITEVKPALLAGQEYGTPTFTHDGVTATRTWPVVTSKTPAERDLDNLNAELLADGSAFKGLASYVFGLAKGTIAVNPSLTRAQFATAVRNLMRNGS